MALFGLPAAWTWLGLGLALMAAEVLVAPGTYLLWIGLAALGVSAVTALAVPGPALEFLLFGLFSLASGLAGWRLYGARAQDDAARDLHNPEITLIGREAMLVAPIENGIGQARLDDVFWRVSGPDLPAGTRVRILAVDGSTLRVAAL